MGRDTRGRDDMCKVWVKQQGKRQRGRPGCRWEGDIMELK